MSQQEDFEKLLRMYEDAKRLRLAYLVQLARFAEKYDHKIEDAEKMVKDKKYGL